MINTKSDTNNDFFCTFLKKEQQLASLEKEHAQAIIVKMNRDFKESETQGTIISKIKDFFQNRREIKQLKKIIRKNKIKLSKLDNSEKDNRLLSHKIYKHNDFKTHIFFDRKYTEKNIITDYNSVHFPVIEYEVYMRIEYSIAEIWTSKHLLLTSNSYDDALQYFNTLNSEYKTKSCKNILNDLTNNINKYCDELNREIANLT